MKIYLYITSKANKTYVWQNYMRILQDCNRTDRLEDADIVHILGVWSSKANKITRKAKKMGIPYIVSPLGGISFWNMKKPTTRRPIQRMLYQKKEIKDAQAIVATTVAEFDYLRKRKWNSQIYRISNCILTHQISEAEMQAEFKSIYDKVIAKYEQRKAEKIKERVALSLGEHKEQDNEDAILEQLLQIESRIPHQNIPLSYLQKLQILLHDTEYNDDILEERIEQLKIRKFSQRVFQVMAETTGLTEGYMPIEAIEDKTSKQIQKIITE